MQEPNALFRYYTTTMYRDQWSSNMIFLCFTFLIQLSSLDLLIARQQSHDTITANRSEIIQDQPKDPRICNWMQNLFFFWYFPLVGSSS